MDIELLESLEQRDAGRARPPTSAAAPAAPAPGCASTAWRPSTASTSPRRCSRSRASAACTAAWSRPTWPPPGWPRRGVRPRRHLARGRAPGRPAPALRRGLPAGQAGRRPTCWSATTRTSSWPPGCPRTSTAPRASRWRSRPTSTCSATTPRAALGAGWELAELRERLIDDAWLELKPKWERAARPAGGVRASSGASRLAARASRAIARSISRSGSTFAQRAADLRVGADQVARARALRRQRPADHLGDLARLDARSSARSSTVSRRTAAIMLPVEALGLGRHVLLELVGELVALAPDRRLHAARLDQDHVHALAVAARGAASR